MDILKLLLSILIYGFMMWYMTKNLLLYNQEAEYGEVNTSLWSNKLLRYSLFVFALFAAFRWNVGVDCCSYIWNYYNAPNITIAESDNEAGWFLTEKVMCVIGLPHYFFFFLVAALQLGLAFYAVKEKTFLLSFLPLSLFLTRDYWMWMNGMRQVLACSAGIVAIYFMNQKKYWWSVLIILCAMYVHKSAYVLFLILPVLWLSQGYMMNKWLQIGALYTCFFLQGMGITDNLSTLLQTISMDAGYDENRISILQETLDISFGLRSYMTLGYLTIAMYMSDKVREYVNDKFYDYIYLLFVVGACFTMIFYTNLGILRAMLYFTYYNCFVISATLYYFYKNEMLQSPVAMTLIVFLVINIGYDWFTASFMPDNIESTLYKFSFGRPNYLSL